MSGKDVPNAASRRPNILWICIDRQRQDTLGCFGNSFVRTPNLDRLGADGMVFERAYCQCPILSGQARLDHHREDVYGEYYQAIPRSHRPDGAYATALRNDRYAITAAHRRKTGELYDLTTDPTETVNRWDDPAYLSVKAETLERLCDRMAETIDPLPKCEAGF